MTPSRIYILTKTTQDGKHSEAYTSKKRLYNRLNDLCQYGLVGYEAFTRKLSTIGYEYPVRMFLLPVYKGNSEQYPFTFQMLEVNQPFHGIG